MVGFSSDPDFHFFLHLLDGAAGTLVAVYILVEDAAPALGLVIPLNPMRNSPGSSVLDCSVWVG